MRVGFNAPQWWDLRAGLRPPGQRVDERHVGIPGHGWQHEATEAVHAHLFSTTVWPRLSPPEQALIRSQGGPMSGVPFTCFPVSRESRIDSSSFRVLLLRRLWLPLPPSSRNCRCGLPLDSRGHHRAACARAGVLGGRGWAVENAAARICREAGRVSTKVLVRDLDLAAPHVDDARRLEVVVDGDRRLHGESNAESESIALVPIDVPGIVPSGIPRSRSPPCRHRIYFV